MADALASREGTVLLGCSIQQVFGVGSRSRYNYLPWVDCITAGVPCQDVSIAGKRAGLAGKRTRLVYHFARILRELRPTWFVFENVPGLLSSNDGRDFAEVLRLFMVKCGYGIQWRVLDSQFFGVAQRRERLFIVGRFGRPCPAEVLFESESLPRSLAAGEETRSDVAVPLTSGIGVCGKPAGRRMEDDFNLAVLTASAGHHGHSSDRGDGYSLIAVGSSGERARALTSSAYKRHDDDTDTIIVGALRHLGGGGPDDNEAQTGHLVIGSLDASDGPANLVSAALDSNGVRDFAGLPQGLDSARYRALGNAVTTNVAEWIAGRILQAHQEGK